MSTWISFIDVSKHNTPTITAGMRLNLDHAVMP